MLLYELKKMNQLIIICFVCVSTTSVSAVLLSMSAQTHYTILLNLYRKAKN